MGQAASALAKFDEDQKKKAEAAAKADADARAAAEAAAKASAAQSQAAPPPNQPPSSSSQSGGGGPNIFFGLGGSPGHGGGGVFIGVSPSSPNQSSVSGDQAYCDKLVGLYRRYEQNSPGRRFDITGAAAVEDCQRGKTASGIPVLENILRGDGFTLPAR